MGLQVCLFFFFKLKFSIFSSSLSYPFVLFFHHQHAVFIHGIFSELATGCNCILQTAFSLFLLLLVENNFAMHDSDDLLEMIHAHI